MIPLCSEHEWFAPAHPKLHPAEAHSTVSLVCTYRSHMSTSGVVFRSCLPCVLGQGLSVEPNLGGFGWNPPVSGLRQQTQSSVFSFVWSRGSKLEHAQQALCPLSHLSNPQTGVITTLWLNMSSETGEMAQWLDHLLLLQRTQVQTHNAALQSSVTSRGSNALF